VIPYEGVVECMLPAPNPNGALIDTANSASLHELFETISEPLAGSGWVADSSTLDSGLEMSDICQGQYPSYVLVKGRTYQTPLVYPTPAMAAWTDRDSPAVGPRLSGGIPYRASGLPERQPREPSWDVAPVFEAVVAEARLEPRLFR